MSWKQTTQNSFADSLVVEHKHFFKNIHASFKVMTHGNQLCSGFA
jgi:hypothetical protein